MSYDTKPEEPPRPPMSLKEGMAFVQERLLNGLEQALLPDWEKMLTQASRSTKRIPESQRQDLEVIVKAAKSQAAILRASIGALRRPETLIRTLDVPRDAPVIPIAGTRLPGKKE